MKNAILQWAGIAALGTSLALAQSSSGLSDRSNDQPHQWRHSQQGQSGQQARQNWAARRLERLSTALNLSADQQQQAKSIFADTRAQAQPLMKQLHEGRKALFAAAKAGKSSGEIDALASQQAPLIAQMTAIHAKGFAKFYATLNADQKTKLDSMRGRAGMFVSRMNKH